MHLKHALYTLILATLARAVPRPENVTGDTALHDPTLCKDNTGKYFLFSTGVGIETRTSTDRIAWTLIGKVWPDGANWTDPFTNSSIRTLWAPDCTYLYGQFLLYYSASTSGSQNSAIFFAKSTTGLPGSWTHEGLVTQTSSKNDYNAIDPNLLIDGSTWRLSFGSFWTGIKLQTLDPSSGKPSNATITPLAQRAPGERAIEGNALFKVDNFYYLFTSWDKCCQGVNSTYNIRVGRSTTATGGFVDQAGVALTEGGGTLVLGTHDDIIGPGGQDLMMDTDGVILVYHYYTSAGNFLGINHLNFSSGWPVVS